MVSEHGLDHAVNHAFFVFYRVKCVAKDVLGNNQSSALISILNRNSLFVDCRWQGGEAVMGDMIGCWV